MKMKISPKDICRDFGTCETPYCLAAALLRRQIELRGNLDASRVLIVAAFMAGRRSPPSTDATTAMKYRKRLIKKINRRLGHFGLRASNETNIVIAFGAMAAKNALRELSAEIDDVFARRDYYLPLRLPTSNHNVVRAALTGLPYPIAKEIAYFATQ